MKYEKIYNREDLNQALLLLELNDNISQGSFTYEMFENANFSKKKINLLINAIKIIADSVSQEKTIDKNLMHKIFFIYSRIRIRLPDFLLENYRDDFINRNYLDLYEDIQELENIIFSLFRVS